jgi:hypothetical protein
MSEESPVEDGGMTALENLRRLAARRDRRRRVSAPTPLAEHLAWLESIGSKPCTCRYEWLPSRDYGHGWVRVSTGPDCLEHGTEASR